MNKKRYYYLLAPAVLLMAGVAMSGCSDRDEAAPQVTAKAGEPILFGIADTQSRTHYTEDKYQIDWDVYDKIGIYSDKAEPGSALEGKRFAYYMINQVFPDTDPEHDYHGAIVPVANRNVVKITEGEEAPSLGGEDEKKYGLMWGEEDTFSEEYTFYGAYPACRITKSPADDPDYFTMEYHTNQTVTVESVSNGVYTTKPDMLNAYMMAEKKILPRKDHILLDFDPIMTTLDIHITAGGYELGTGIINPVTITGVSVMMPGALTKKELRYHVAAGTQGGDGSSIRLSDVNTSQKESVFVGIDNYGKRYVDLFEGESISLLAFLPPMDMKTGVKIKVHAVGALNFEVTVKEEMIRQGRIDIQLPDVKPSSEMTPEQAALQTNNWISQLDGNLKLKQLSIPGYTCDGSEKGKDITELLKKGVRAFDMDKMFDKSNKNSNDYESTFKSLEVKETLIQFLRNNPSEFIIIWFHTGGAMGSNYHNYNTDELNDFKSWKGTLPENLMSAKGNLIALKRHNDHFTEYNASIWGNPNLFEFNEIPTKSSGIINPIYDDISDFTDNFNKEESANWKAWYVTSWYQNDEDIEETNRNINKRIYEHIANTDQQKGYTGIVMVPRANDIYDEATTQPTYSDLLIQSIIDCNYKFTLDKQAMR